MKYKIKDGLPGYVSEILQREKISGIVKEFSIERKDDDDILNIGMPESYVLTVLINLTRFTKASEQEVKEVLKEANLYFEAFRSGLNAGIDYSEW